MQRKVILEQSEDEIHIDDVNDDCIIGAYLKEEGHVMVITIVDDEYRSVWLYTDQMQENNYSGKDLNEIIKEMIEDGLEVFQFDDELDFANWSVGIFGPDKPKVANEATPLENVQRTINP